MVQFLEFPGLLMLRFMKSRPMKWVVSNRILTALFLVFVVVFFSFPSYDLLLKTDELREGWDNIFLQAKEPFVSHYHMYQEGWHAQKLAFRFVPALLLNLFSITSIEGGLVFQFMTLILFYLLLSYLFYQLFKDGVKSLLYALPLSLVIAGHVYVSDYRGFFDTVALDFLLIALLLRNKIFVIIPLLLAYFTDERALIASTSIFLINAVKKDHFKSGALLIREFISRDSVLIYASWLAYLIIRIALKNLAGLTIGDSLPFYLIEQIHLTGYAIYIGLEGFLILFALVIWFLFRNGIRLFPLFIVGNYLLLLYAALSVFDINRSMSFALIFIILLLILADRILESGKMIQLVSWVILINLVYDDFYPLAAQLYRMKFISHTI